MSTTTAATRWHDPGPLDLELARAEVAAATAARAALRDRAPASSPCCQSRAYRDGIAGPWRCGMCGRGFHVPGPSAAEEEAAVREATAAARARVLDPVLDTLGRRIATERARDRRPLGPLQAAWRQSLLHRANPSRYPATAATREWQDDRLLDLAQKYLEVTGHESPFTLRAQELVPVVLFRGTDQWTRTAQGFHTTSDFSGVPRRHLGAAVPRRLR